MNKGFTLIELIIYIGIVAAVLLVAVNFGWEIIYGNVKSQALREVQQNSRFAMEKITRSLLAGNATTTFNVSNSTLYQNGIAITTNRVKVTNLQFTNISYNNAPGSIKIEMTIEHVNPNHFSQYEASLETENTVSLRK